MFLLSTSARPSELLYVYIVSNLLLAYELLHKFPCQVSYVEFQCMHFKLYIAELRW